MRTLWIGRGELVRRRLAHPPRPCASSRVAAAFARRGLADVLVLYVTRYRPAGAAARTLAELVGHAPVVVLARDWDLAEARAACAAGAIACLEASSAPEKIADAVSEAGAVSAAAASRRPSSRRAAA